MFVRNRTLKTTRRSLTTAALTGRSRARLALTTLEDRAVPATLTVLNNNDSGAGSLRAMLGEASSPTRPGHDDIVFAAGVVGTITVASSLPVASDISILGPGANVLAISGNNLVRVFDVTDGTSNTMTASISGLTIRNGAAASGAGISVGQNDVLSLDAVHVSANVATTHGGGIDVANGGGLSILSSTLSGNTANLGGALYFGGSAIGGTVTLRNSTVSNNIAGQGGGIALSSFGGDLAVTNTTMVQNKATAGSGGGIVRVSGVGTVSLTSSIVWGNTTSAVSGPDISTSGTVNYRYSLLGNSSGITTLTDKGNNIAIGTNPFITALGNNGGPTPTHALILGSAAIDKGTNSSKSLTTAQNGTTRTFGPADIGAFEYTTAGVPTVCGTFDDVTMTGGSTYTFSLKYTDDVFINVANLSTGQDISISGPNGFFAWATFQSVDNPTNGSPRVATYSFTPPGGMWDSPDAGVYTVSIAKNAVYDSAANPVPPGEIGQFNVEPAGGTFVVTNDLDSGAGSLRNAVTLANATTGNDVIMFDPVFFAVIRNITLTTGEIPISDPVTIQGVGSNLLSVSGNSASRIFAISNGVAGGMSINISGMILADGVASTPGGAISVVDETLNLNGVVFNNNRTTSTGPIAGGGAIAITGAGMLQATDCSFTNNKATGSGGDGGAIRSAAGSSVTLTNCLVSGNSANGDGGGAYVTGSGTASSLFVVSSAFINNVATDLTGDGGGIFFVGTVGGSGLVLRNSTVSGNQANGYGGGVGISNLVGNFTVQNSTITNNSGGSAGKGGGVGQLGGTGVVNFESSIVSGNFNTAAPDAFTTSKMTFATSALGNATGIANYVDNGNNLPIGSLLNLGALANNGGPTPSHMPNVGSLLIDHGSNPSGLTTDQRGVNRTDGVAADIGAVEAPSPGLPVASVTSLPNVLVAGGTVYEFLITYKDETAINVSTLDNLDIRITGPNGYNQLAKFVKTDVAGNGTPRVATYSMAIPGGSWNGADAGIYSVSLEANQVADTTAKFAVGGTLGSFKVDLPNTYVVTNDNDAGPGSLRAAVLASNVTDSTDTITFDPTFFKTPKTITLTTGELLVTRSLLVQGPGAAVVTVSGGNTTRIFDINDGSAATSIDVTMNGMTLTAGRSVAEGGAIYIYNEHVTLNGVGITNSTTQTGSGAGIYVADKTATLTMADCSLSNNTAGLGSSGGGLRVDGAATVNITRSTISGNVASLAGGGIYFNNGGSLTITDSTLSGNAAKVEDGGALYFFGPIGSGLVIRNCTISGNSAGKQGGGIAFTSVTGTPVIQNCTVTSNIANSGFGGGIARIAGTNSINLESTIVAGNTGGSAPDLSFNTLTALTADRNLIGVADLGNFTMSGANNLTGDSGSPLDAKLGALSTNFGGTQTHALLAGSPAINKGSNPGSALFDQRGVGFNRVAGASADIGAFEVQTPPIMTGLVINDGAIQRSRVLSITVPFNTLVNFTGGNPGSAITLERMNGATPVGTVSLSFDLSGSTASQTIVKLTFSGAQTQFGSLVDGLYRLTINSAAVTNFSLQNLDGNGDGTAGDNFVSAPGAIHRLFGDGNGDRVVNSVDFALFRTFFGIPAGPTSAFDFDASGGTDPNDFSQFRNRFGMGI